MIVRVGLFGIVAFLWSVQSFAEKVASDVLSKQSVSVVKLPSFETRVEPYNHLFPAMELVRLGVSLKGARLHKMSVRLLSASKSRIWVEAELPGILRATGVIEAGKTEQQLDIQWQVGALAQQPLARMMSMRFSLDNKQGERAVRWHQVRLHASHELLLGVEPRSAPSIDFNWTLAAFVDEASPAADKILQRAQQSGVVQQFSGYASADSEEIYAQLFAIWHALQKRGMRYSNLAKSVREHPALLIQPVRSATQSYQEKRANCVDGSLLIASSLQKIGLRSALVILPGHMLLGVSLDPEGDEWIYLETTEMGNLTASAERDALSELTDMAESDIGLRQSLRSFEQALARGQAQVDQAGDRFFDPNNIEYQIIDLFAARARGIRPVPVR
jgi:hypothetical protein